MNPTQSAEKQDLKVGTVYADVVKTEKFEANEAKIKNLTVELVRAKKIKAELIKAKKVETEKFVAAEAEIKQLNVEIANIREANIELARIKQAEIDEANIKLANIQQANIELAKIKRAEIEQANIGRMVAANTTKAKACPDGRLDCTQPIFLPAKTKLNYFAPGVDLVDIQDPNKKAGVAASKIQVFPGGRARIQVVRYNGQSSEAAFQAAVARAQGELAQVVGQYQGKEPGTCRYQRH